MAMDNGVTPMFRAAYNGHADALQLLLQAKADPDKADNDGVTPVYMAAWNDHADALRAAGKVVIMGGIHATVCPEEAMQHADAVVTVL